MVVKVASNVYLVYLSSHVQFFRKKVHVYQYQKKPDTNKPLIVDF